MDLNIKDVVKKVGLASSSLPSKSPFMALIDATSVRFSTELCKSSKEFCSNQFIFCLKTVFETRIQQYRETEIGLCPCWPAYYALVWKSKVETKHVHVRTLAFFFHSYLVLAINPTTQQSYEAFKARAMCRGSSATGSATSVSTSTSIH